MNRTVLIVDEDVNAQIIAETLLRLRGLHVRVAADGTEACQVIHQEDVAVVVLDLNLPEMEGFQIFRQLRACFERLPLPTRPPIVAVSTRKEPEVERFVFRLGAAAFLRKPLEPRQFISTIESLMATTVPGLLGPGPSAGMARRQA